MGFDMDKLGALDGAGFDAIIDVRSPSEYAEDHVPGAINLPALSDAERARVGTIYVQDSAFKARKIGAALVARNAASHIEGPLADKDGGWQPLVYCWRGGQRSASFASILQQIGWRAECLCGGYRSYRRLVVRRLYEDRFLSPVILLDGNTGTAKTEVLALLNDRDIQVIDLEALANHRGSALGGQGEQPSQKAFETRLAREVDALDPARPVVIEAESSKVGKLSLPTGLFAAMKDARRLRIEAPVKARAAYLTRTYGDLVQDTTVLMDRLDRLVRLQGREKVQAWKDMALAGQHVDLAEQLIRDHYDPRYIKGRERRNPGEETVLAANDLGAEDLDRLADDVARIVNAPAK
ncbi:MAG: tRNA 2-selenouridine(34) synthase MnmH [Silicimonas sp.]|nr:tRNA 2-selenouridine(34) synthase MnmH [Silicimonas sp.]